MKLGRLPLRVSAMRVNCETARISPPTSLTPKFIFPSSALKILKPTIFSASQPASPSPSSLATPTRSRRPSPISEILSPETVTEAFLTLWRTTRTALERPTALVAGLNLVPVLDAFFGWMPAEEDHASFALVREVQQAHVQVLEQHAELPDALYREVEVVGCDAVLGADPPAAVGSC